MEGRLSEEIEVKQSRGRRPRLTKEGDDGLKTGTTGPSSFKEKFAVVDDERRVKVSEVVEGGYLDMGFTLYRICMEVIEKEGQKGECIVRGSIEYELKEEAAANAALVSIEPVVAVMQVAADYLTKNYNINV
ncbi:UNVERIFIED_CONTAM: hypothetical protein Sangu_0729200 [Sesamum angustifolium]|uniref:Bet v I/Major latex protein domain-containing protein n=1 Tax=Sesamum angustifolium TaxID=2727405 RepID=A0AAW2IM22_9LAMI